MWVSRAASLMLLRYNSQCWLPFKIINMFCILVHLSLGKCFAFKSPVYDVLFFILIAPSSLTKKPSSFSATDDDFDVFSQSRIISDQPINKMWQRNPFLWHNVFGWQVIGHTPHRTRSQLHVCSIELAAAGVIAQFQFPKNCSCTYLCTFDQKNHRIIINGTRVR